MATKRDYLALTPEAREKRRRRTEELAYMGTPQDFMQLQRGATPDILAKRVSRRTALLSGQPWDIAPTTPYSERYGAALETFAPPTEYTDYLGQLATRKELETQPAFTEQMREAAVKAVGMPPETERLEAEAKAKALLLQAAKPSAIDVLAGQKTGAEYEKPKIEIGPTGEVKRMMFEPPSPYQPFIDRITGITTLPGAPTAPSTTVLPPLGEGWEVGGINVGGVTIKKPEQKTIPAEAITSLSIFKEIGDATAEAKQIYDEIQPYVGPGGKAVGWMREATGLAEPQEKAFRMKIRSLIRRAYAESGKQISEKEISRLEGFIPTLSTPRPVFDEAMKTFMTELQSSISTRLDIYEAAGYKVPDVLREKMQIEEPNILETATDPNTGKKLGWTGTEWIPLN